jgi:hypothetical protein
MLVGLRFSHFVDGGKLPRLLREPNLPLRSEPAPWTSAIQPWRPGEGATATRVAGKLVWSCEDHADGFEMGYAGGPNSAIHMTAVGLSGGAPVIAGFRRRH